MAENRRSTLGICALLLLQVALVFGQTVDAEFVNFDDDDYVYENAHVQKGLTLPGAVWAFTQFHVSNWHPLTWLSHMLDVELFHLHAGGHHLTSMLLHAASAVVLFLVLRQMTGRQWPCALVAALFAIHPLHVESVAWIAERKDVLSGLCFVLTLAAYQGYVSRPYSLGRYLLVVTCFAVGLMAKPMLVTLPFVLLLLDYWPIGRRGLGLIFEKIPLFLLAAASCLVTVKAQSTAMMPLEQLPWTVRAVNAVTSYCIYLGESFWTAGLAVFYPYVRGGSSVGAVIAMSALLAGLSLAAIALERRCPYLLVGWLWYLGMLAPVIGLVQVGSQSRADRYMYLPLIGPALALAWATADFAGASLVRRRLCGAAWSFALVALTVLAWLQTSTWRDSEALWTHALDSTTGNASAHYHLGNALTTKEKYEAAIEQYRKALDFKPDVPEVHGKLGLALEKVRQYDAAAAEYQTILTIDPRDAQAYLRLGEIRANQGRYGDAAGCFRKALEINPDLPDVHSDLGMALDKIGQSDAAIRELRMALESEPDSVDVHRVLSNILQRVGKYDAAIMELQNIVRLDPRDAGAYNNLAWIRAAHPDARFRDGAEAVTLALRAAELSPNDPSVLDTLAVAYAEAGRFPEAVQTAEQAIGIATAGGGRDLAEQIRGRLKFYRKGKPYHDPTN